MLKDWNLDYNFKWDMLRILLVWAKLPKLPISLWGAKSLGKIGSALGNPLFTDECIPNKLRVSYAWILVEIDITQKSKEVVRIKISEGKWFDQPIEYECKPKYCESCQQIGHQCEK